MTHASLETLQRVITDAIVPLQQREPPSQQALDRLVDEVSAQVHAHRGAEVLPRQLLREIHTSAAILHREAEHLGEHAPAVVKAAHRIDFLFGLLLRGESPEDRQPGVPRIL